MLKLVSTSTRSQLFAVTARYAATKKVSSMEGLDMQKAIDGGTKQSVDNVVKTVNDFEQMVNDSTQRFNQNYEAYYGKERDFENFPTLKMQEFHPKVRMGFVPDAWFDAFYQKSGVLGPYFLLFGGVNFLLSKEYWVMDHEFWEVPMAAGALIVLAKKVGPKLSQMVAEKREKVNCAIRERPLKSMKECSENMLKDVETVKEVRSIGPTIMEAKRENVALQLELDYRERLQKLHNAVKQRLDYQLVKAQAKRQMQQEHMANWINDSVLKSITAQQEKEALQQCVTNLKALAQQHKASGATISSMA